MKVVVNSIATSTASSASLAQSQQQERSFQRETTTKSAALLFEGSRYSPVMDDQQRDDFLGDDETSLSSTDRSDTSVSSTTFGGTSTTGSSFKDILSSSVSFQLSSTDAMVSTTPQLRSRANSSSSVIVIGGGSINRERTASHTDIEMQHQYSVMSPNNVAATSSTMRNQRRGSHLQNKIALFQNNSSSHGLGTSSSSLYRASAVHKSIGYPPFTQQQQPRSAPSSLPRRIVDWIQSRQVPKVLVRKYYKRSGTATTTTPLTRNSKYSSSGDYPYTSTMADTMDNDADDGVVYWISGLDRVFFGVDATTTSTTGVATNIPTATTATSGTSVKGTCCAEDVYIAGMKPPRYLWYMLSGALCDVVQLSTLAVLYSAMSSVSMRDKAAMCWCLAFVMSIPVRHVCHRYLVFGDFVGGYYKSLLRMYAGYSVTIVLSTIFNFVMSRAFVNSTIVDLSILTLLWTGIANYFILKHFWKVGSSTTSATLSKHNSSNVGSMS